MGEKIKQAIRRRRSVMVQAEWRHLLQSKTLLVAVIALAFVPVIYAAFFLGSVWDPYGHTDRLPIAFVNEDKGAQINGKELQIGRTMTEPLHKSKELKWEFVSKQQADDGVRRGYYYAVVTVPEDFSQRAASLRQDKPQQAVVSYQLTPAKNYIGAVISRQAAQKVKETVAEQVTQTYLKEVAAGIGAVGNGMAQAGDGAGRLHQGSARLQAGLNHYTNGVSQLASKQQTLTTSLGRLQAGATQVQQGTAQLTGQLPTAAQVAQLTAGMQQIKQGINTLNTQVAQPSPVVAAQQAAVVQDAQRVVGALQAMQAPAASAGAILQKTSAQAAASGGSTTITLPELQTIASALQQTKAIAEQTQSLLANLDTLTKTLTTQQQTLKNGVAALNTGVEQFAPQATTAFAGYNTVRAGGERLQAGAALVAGNLATARQGSGQLAQGAATLQQHSSTLVQASNQLADGSSTLAHKLQTGAAQVKLLPTSPAAQQQMAAPVASSEHSTGSVPNYGYAMAPYMLSLALFVGGLALTTMYPVRKTFSRQENAWRWWLAKMSVLGLAALVQATIMMLVLVYVVGLQPDHPWLFAATSYLASLAFMSLITLLVMVLDNPGRLVVMIIMVLQLAASEGIFPIQTASGFFQAINPWLPMTHSIIAYRHAISGGVDSALYTQHMLILAGFALVANALLIGFLAWRGTRQFAHTTVDGD